MSEYNSQPKPSWEGWKRKKDLFKRTGSTIEKKPKQTAIKQRIGQGRSHITGNIYKHD